MQGPKGISPDTATKHEMRAWGALKETVSENSDSGDSARNISTAARTTYTLVSLAREKFIMIIIMLIIMITFIIMGTFQHLKLR